MAEEKKIKLSDATNERGERLTSVLGDGVGRDSYVTEPQYRQTHSSLVNLQQNNSQLFVEVRNHLNADSVSDVEVKALRQRLDLAGYQDLSLDKATKNILRDSMDQWGAGVKTEHTPRMMLSTEKLTFKNGNEGSVLIDPRRLNEPGLIKRIFSNTPLAGGLIVAGFTMASGANASEIAYEGTKAGVPGASLGESVGKSLAAVFSAAVSTGSVQQAHLDNLKDFLYEIAGEVSFGLIQKVDGESLEDKKFNLDVFKMALSDLDIEKSLGFTVDELLATKSGREYLSSQYPHEASNINTYAEHYASYVEDKAAGIGLINTAEIKAQLLENNVSKAISALEEQSPSQYANAAAKVVISPAGAGV